MGANRKRGSAVRVSIHELKILTLLSLSASGLFASEIIHLSGGLLKRGSVYSLLQRLEAKQFVHSRVIPASSEYNLDRPLYTITTDGIEAIQSFVKFFGFVWVRESVQC